MEKILVTTDFSTNSKAGIRFAIQLASQTNSELIFYNVIQILKPTVWSVLKWNNYAAEEIESHQKKLKKFIQAIYKTSNLEEPNYKCVSEVATEVDEQIVSFAKKIKANYICMSTKGAGNIQKIFGTNASALITSSPIPVVVVPHTYRIKPITSIWYASDYENLKPELTAVTKFNQELQAHINITHYYMANIFEDEKKTKTIIAKNQSEKVQFNSIKRNIGYSLVQQIQTDVKKLKPSLLVLFTKQNRSWFERWFLSSKTAELTFDLKTPMLVFRKK
jgi:nucleotide-binding universal stress UspA family protein